MPETIVREYDKSASFEERLARYHVDQDLADKVVRLRLQGVADEQIILICALDQQEFDLLTSHSDYQKVSAKLEAEPFQRYSDLDEGWDSLEEQALGNLLEVTKYTRNPDLMLRVASIANKATRRNTGRRLLPLEPERQGARVVIELQRSFVSRLQTVAENVAAQGLVRSASKQVNILPPQKVEILLNQPTKDEEELFAGIDLESLNLDIEI